MRPEKEMMVDEIVRQMGNSKAVMLANYMGLKSQELEEFRSLLKPIASDCMVVKNTMVSRAIAKASLPAVDEHLTGPTAIIFGSTDDVTLAKRVMSFIKDHELLKLKVGILERLVVSKEQIAQLALLPSREVLLARLVGQLKAPLAGLVGVLSAVPRGLVLALNAIREKKEQVEKPTADAAPAA